MSYKRAEQLLPLEIIKIIQDYVDGEYIYIPRKENKRRTWGEKTHIRKELYERNLRIYSDYKKGMTVAQLAVKYYLSDKSIQRIIREMKMTHNYKSVSE
jgi:Mor family transcriptional regulator